MPIRVIVLLLGVFAFVAVFAYISWKADQEHLREYEEETQAMQDELDREIFPDEEFESQI